MAGALRCRTSFNQLSWEIRELYGEPRPPYQVLCLTFNHITDRSYCFASEARFNDSYPLHMIIAGSLTVGALITGALIYWALL